MAANNNQEIAALIQNSIREIPDFPKPGILFKDISTLLLLPDIFSKVISGMAEHYKDTEVDLIAGIESRGFIIGAALALFMKKGFVMLRKPNKLPGPKIGIDYGLEYGNDRLEVHSDNIEKGQKILIVDDLVATGGSMKAACTLIERCGGTVIGCVCLIELNLGGRQFLQPYPLCSFLSHQTGLVE